MYWAGRAFSLYIFLDLYGFTLYNSTLQANSNAPTHVPAGIAACPEELFVQPESFIGGKFKNIVSYTDMERCGHFAAFEEPELLANDVFAFVGKVERLRAADQPAAQPDKELWKAICDPLKFLINKKPFSQWRINDSFLFSTWMVYSDFIREQILKNGVC